MPTRATKRGVQRTPIDRDCDVLICGGSFAGLAVARELARTGANVMVIDRYEIGERQTSACGIPTRWLEVLDLTAALQQRGTHQFLQAADLLAEGRLRDEHPFGRLGEGAGVSDGHEVAQVP